MNIEFYIPKDEKIEWNKDVYSTKHWANNPWTNWFYSKRIADDMKMIERRANSGRED